MIYFIIYIVSDFHSSIHYDYQYVLLLKIYLCLYVYYFDKEKNIEKKKKTLFLDKVFHLF